MNNKSFSFSSADDPNGKKTFKTIVFGAVLSLLVMTMTALIVFFLTIQPNDETMVPGVTAMDLTEAMLLLQENNLKTHITTEFNDKQPAGVILFQKPSSGLYVKIDSTVDLVVSQGAPVNKVENFTGQTLQDVRKRLLTVYRELLTLKEPIVYVFDEHPAGTVIDQKPKSGFEISGPMQLELVVSRGPSVHDLPLSSYLGLSYDQALRLLGETGLGFSFTLDSKNDGQGSVTAQNPSPGTTLKADEKLRLTLTVPSESADAQHFGLYEFNLPDSPEPLDVKVSLRRENSIADQTLFQTRTAGTELSIPYLAKAGDQIILSINENEIDTQTVQ